MEMKEVVHSLRLQSQSKNYSELGSCPSLNSGRRPLLARSIGGAATADNKSADADDGSSGTGHFGAGPTTEESINTSKGMILVARQGDSRKPAIITYHDLALNHTSNFQTFFGSGAMASVVETFCLYHITAPGQENGAEDLPETFVYPTMDELSEQVEYVMHYYGITHCVGLGVGLGANVLVRFARRRPTMVDGLILINCNSQGAGWVEWVYHKVNIKSLKRIQQQRQQQSSSRPLGLPDSVVDYLMWYHLGRPDSDGRPLEAVSIASIYKQYFSSAASQSFSCRNLALLLASYMTRSDLGLAREVAPNGKPLFGATRTLRMPVINMTGDHSPHVDATVVFNGRLQPNRCTWMKIQDSAMILEEQPAKVAEAIKLFLQGLGYNLKRVGQAVSGRNGSGRSHSLYATSVVGQIETADVVSEDTSGEAEKNDDKSEENNDNTAKLVEGLEELTIAATNE